MHYEFNERMIPTDDEINLCNSTVLLIILIVT